MHPTHLTVIETYVAVYLETGVMHPTHLTVIETRTTNLIKYS